MLSAPPAFILSQDRTLRSKTRGLGPAPAGRDPALLDFGPPGRSSADQTFGFTRKNDEVLKTQSESTPGLSSGSKQFLASLSSSISSIAVSGFQGSPRGHRRARSYYTPPEGRARPKPRSPRYLHELQIVSSIGFIKPQVDAPLYRKVLQCLLTRFIGKTVCHVQIGSLRTRAHVCFRTRRPQLYPRVVCEPQN